MRRLLALTLTLSIITPALAHAQGYASAQAAVGSPQAALVTPQAALAPAYDTCNAALAAPVLQSYAVPQQQVIAVRRQIVAQPVYVQQAPVVVQRQVYAAPVLQQAIVSPYVPQAQALASVGYGVGAQQGLVVNRGLRQRAQKTVSRSRAVTVTRRPGVINRVLGR